MCIDADNTVESHDGKFGSFRLSGQLSMVHADEYHSLLEQGRSLPTEAPPLPIKQLLPRLLGRQRCEPSSEVSSLAIQPSESRTPESLSTVRIDGLRHTLKPSGANNLCSLTQATDTTNIRLVFAAVKETILQNALKDSGIL